MVIIIGWGMDLNLLIKMNRRLKIFYNILFIGFKRCWNFILGIFLGVGGIILLY